MAKKIYMGVKKTAEQAEKMYLGVEDLARRIKKIYIGVDDIARICFKNVVKILYESTLTQTFTEKELWIKDPYGDFPIAANANRVDFWFKPDSVATNDSTKKYVDYPWCAYADANPSLYTSYGYAQDLLAKHWNETGESSGLSKGGIAEEDICDTDVDHTLQHAYRSKKVTVTTKDTGDPSSGYAFVTAVNSKGTTLFTHNTAGSSNSKTNTLYPGMILKLYARHASGIADVGSDGSACAVKINGTKVAGRGTYEYTIPDNIKTISVTVDADNHWDGGESWVITVTTTTI